MKEKLYNLLIEKNIDDEQHRARVRFELKELKKYETITHSNLLKEIENGSKPDPNILIWYLLGYTHIDPVDKTPEYIIIPGKSPDLDLDFEDAERGRVIDYIKRRFGQQNVAQVCNIITYSIKSAFQDAARIFGIPAQRAFAISKTINEKDWSSSRNQYAEIFKFAEQLLGQMRNFGRHAAAVIVTDKPVQKYVPVRYNSTDDMLLTEFSGESILETKLLKLDILGLSTLKIMKSAISLIQERHKVIIKLDDIDFDDSKVFDLFSKGLTTSVFQFESASMKGYLQKLQPRTLEDIVAMNALFRPGTIPIINNYIRRKHGQEEIEYAHPILKQVLEPTLGLLIYQEETISIAHLASGMSLGRADLLRRYMEKWNSKFKNDVKGKRKWEAEFFKGCKKQGLKDQEIKIIWDYLIRQTGYTFCRAHSLSYAIIAYYTAWLKVRYPVEFMCASLNSDKTPIDRLAAECKQLNIDVLYPCVNKSQPHFSIVNDKTIIYGLSSVKNCGTVPANWISSHAPYGDITDFFLQLSADKKIGRKVNKRVLDSLIQAGAFDSLYSNRKMLFENYDEWRKKHSQITFERYTEDKNTSDYSNDEKMKLLEDLLTIDVSTILLEKQKKQIQELRTYLDKHAIIGIITDITRKQDRNGNMMAFVSIRDEEGLRRFPLFARQYNESSQQLIKNKLLVFKMAKMKSGDLLISKIMVPA